MSLKKASLRKTFAVLLALAVIFSMIPATPVFAADAAPPAVTGGMETGVLSSYQYLEFKDGDAFLNALNVVQVNDDAYERKMDKLDLSGKYFYMDKNNKIYFYKSYSSGLQTGDIITMQAAGYSNLVMTVEVADGTNFVVKSFASSTDPDEGGGKPGDETGGETEKQPPCVSGSIEEGMFANYLILTICDDTDYLDQVSGVKIGAADYTAIGSSYPLREEYVVNKEKQQIILNNGLYSSYIKAGDSITITAEGYRNLVLTVRETDDGTITVEPADSIEPDDDEDDTLLKEAPMATAQKISSGFSDFQAITISDDVYVGGITGISVNSTEWNSVSSSSSLWDAGTYYLNAADHQIWFDGTSSGVLKTGNIITIKNPAYKDLVLQVLGEGENFDVAVYDPEGGSGEASGPSDGVNTLHVRLVGKFEAALVGQQKYDGISGASTNVSANKNSDVEVQAAVLPNDQEPTEEDWKNLSIIDEVRVNADKTKTFVTISPEGSGMCGVYSPYDGSLTLAGTPQKAGNYAISVTITDVNGRTVVSNSLPFVIYTGDEKLIHQLTLENSTQTQDGKYMYDMEPWAITKFGGQGETVTVPKEIKAWYGSHTSGTYGELGYAVTGEPVQTLIVPEGCNLTLVNMKVLSSVRIVVENGGSLNLRDSSVHGNIEVMDGGRFSMNYDAFGGEFLDGASINGQLILNDGAVLENSVIYSNSNYLPNGSEARQNTEPVVLVKGNVTANGQIYIKGDEAPTGTDPATGKSYSGQPALKVENGSLNITEGSVVAAYGGGNSALTSVGGDAVILDNGTITGDGKLIAVGGIGEYDNGGNAVSGAGNITVDSAYLEGGETCFPKEDSITAGKAVTEGVAVSDQVKVTLVDGNRITSNSQETSDSHWGSTTELPDLTHYLTPDKAPGEDADKPGNDKPGDNKPSATYPSIPASPAKPAENYDAQIAAIENLKLIARSKLTHINGAKAVRVHWYAEDGADLTTLDMDGYQVFRSVKRYSGYGKKPFFVTKNTYYYNTDIEIGTRYYYKIRGYKELGGTTYYTDWSKKAWRLVK